MTIKISIMYILLCISVYTFSNNRIIINQIMYDSPLNEKTNQSPHTNGEFLELYNGNDTTVDISGWSLKGGSKTEIVTFSNISIPALGYLIVAYRHTSTPSFELSDIYDSLDNTSSNVQIVYQKKLILSNSTGDTIRLRNAIGQTIDSVYYDGDCHKTKPNRLSASNSDSIAGDLCVSLHRIKVQFDSNGCTIDSLSLWQTSLVTFQKTNLLQPRFDDNYIFGDNELPHNANYILSVKPLNPTNRITTQNGKVSLNNSIRCRSSIIYFDGLGRTKEQIGISASPDGSDILSLQQYDGINRFYKQWLPITNHNDGQPLNVSEYISFATNEYSDNRPFKEYIYENSDLDRITNKKRAGETYQNNPQIIDYDINNENDNVRIFDIIIADSEEKIQYNGLYATNTLHKTTTSDEDGKYTISFTDLLGRTIMQRRDNTDWYYVYDKKGLLRCVFPYHSHFISGLINPATDEYIRGLGYFYKYDGRGNIIYKQIPCHEANHMIYDADNQLILTQDGNQQSDNKWLFIAYDSIGRNIYSAEIILQQTYQQLTEICKSLWCAETYSGTQSNLSFGYSDYTLQLLSATNIKTLTVKYYDNYDFLNIVGNNLYALKYIPPTNGDTANLVATSLLTGERTYNLSDNGFIVSSLYYDKLGQLIESRQVQHDDGIYITKHSYNFDGTTNQKNISHIHPEAEYTIFEKYHYQYDNQGRMKDVKYITMQTDTVQLFALKYDKFGRLAQKLRHNSLDTISYIFDINSQLTGTYNSNYTEKLFYADSLPIQIEKMYNGNISACQTTILDTTISMVYHYDSQNRLTEAKCSLGQSDYKLSEKITYDLSGNIQTLKRFHSGTLIDDLSYYYSDNSNQLISIIDAIETSTTPIEYYKTKQYHDNNHSNIDFTYDNNGNMTSDADRKITHIKYNLLNLPDTVLFANGNKIINMYDAKGTKYKTIYATNLLNTVTPFENISNQYFETDSIEYYTINREHNYEYHTTSDTSISKLYNIEGYMPSYNTYCYYYKDHLGNNVITRQINANGNDSIIQKISYYSTGLPTPDSWGLSAQALTYNGKEFITMHGFDIYDYEFRNYYAVIGRFTSIDPLADITKTNSPYSYSSNNWVNNIDYKGLYSLPKSPIRSNDKKDAYNFTKINNNGIVIEHIDDEDDTRVIVVKDDGTEEEIGTEIEDENYKVGKRVFFKFRSNITAFYDFINYKKYTPNTSFEVRFGEFLSAKKVDKFEEKALEYIFPFVKFFLAFCPNVSLTNDIYTLAYDHNIYGEPTDTFDDVTSVIDIITMGLSSEVMPAGKIKTVASSIKNINTITSSSKTLTEDVYEKISKTTD